MNPTSFDVKDILEDESELGLVFATNLFIGYEPPMPNNVVTIFDTPGRKPQLNYATREGVENYYYPSIQIRVRNLDYTDGWDLAKSIMDKLHGRSGDTVNSTYYELFDCMTEPTLLDWDQKKRARFIMNFDIQRR